MNRGARAMKGKGSSGRLNRHKGAKRGVAMVTALLVLFMPLCIFMIGSHAQERTPLQLSEVEMKWLKAHGEITYGADEDYAPFEFVDKNGELIGVNIAYLDIIEKRIGVKIRRVSGKWSDTLAKLPAGEVDVISASITDERKKSMSFSTSFMDIPSAIIVRKDNTTIKAADDLSSARVATVEGWGWNDDLKQDFPNIELVPYPSLLASFNAVAFGEVDATVMDVATAGYVIEHNKITTLRMASEYPSITTLHFTVRKGDPILMGILQKAIDSISKEEIKVIYEEWVKPVSPSFYETREFAFAVGLLGILFIGMGTWTVSLRSEVRRRTEDLRATNEELEEIIAEMNSMERKLVEQEKMAALGSMVAGITHEVNAPLGIMVTGISVMENHLEKTKNALEENALKKSELMGFFSEMDEHVSLLNNSVTSAIELLNNMKTMSVDQMAEQKERFELCTYLNKVRSNLRYECKKRGATFEVVCDGPHQIESYPGAFSQIITNLVFNSLIHGFENKLGGKMRLEARLHGDVLEMVYEDDGVGITEETMDHMFEAFFTSKRQSGGSGLGMHIIKTLVEERLKGTISCESEYGKGIRFVMRFPVEV